MASLPPIEKIYVERGSEGYKITNALLEAYPETPRRSVLSADEAFSDLKQKSADPIRDGKKRLFIGRHKGPFLKKCPGTRGMVCCNYYVLNIATQCALDCSYCVLQEYFSNNPVLKLFCNMEDSLSEIEELARSRPEALFRIGTGEFTDSLTLDEAAGFSHTLIPFFMGKKNLILELKTKTANIGNLLKYDRVDNIVVAWSLNPASVIEAEEHGTASLNERFEAAGACLEKGYEVGFHFDPMILFDGWEEEYKNVVDMAIGTVPANRIAWISLGGFRFRPTLKEVIRARFPKSALLTGEHLLSDDGKARYFRSLRIDAYRKMVKWIRRHDRSVRVYLCMESPEVWRRVMKRIPMCQDKPDLLFD